MTLEADGLFAFGSSRLQAAGEARIDALAAKIGAAAGAPHVAVVGHTDRIGSDQANLALSMARAQAVRARPRSPPGWRPRPSSPKVAAAANR